MLLSTIESQRFKAFGDKNKLWNFDEDSLNFLWNMKRNMFYQVTVNYLCINGRSIEGSSKIIVIRLTECGLKLYRVQTNYTCIPKQCSLVCTCYKQ